ncbi:hypothetical protein [Magnetofaba australis]|uniref:Uncharacterized protein n=1 Tax=Magnetofaba australis IT-1 TaxID=1434232 RepID=A0A1Y2K6J2_9PROT|nr:hypothetical protein [Magnetofaba australis]OSM03962.1 hypothetical protein MAIT1_03792 [Magnetofaba australis IT-1]
MRDLVAESLGEMHPALFPITGILLTFYIRLFPPPDSENRVYKTVVALLNTLSILLWLLLAWLVLMVGLAFIAP